MAIETEVRKFQPADDLHGRLRTEREITELLIREGEPWPQGLGIYSDPHHSLVNLSTLPSELFDRLSLAKNPPTFQNQLKNIITNVREIKPTNQPVVVLDIGGGAGTTWCEMTREFEEEVARGDVAFVVSNMCWSAEQFLARSSTPLPPCSLPDGLSSLHFVTSSFRRLNRQIITLPDGRIIPLRGNVDIAHESYSLTSWSQVPELDILSVPGLLSRQGSYYIAPLDSPFKYHVERENQLQRERAVRNTQNLLQTKYGLQLVKQVEAGEFQGVDLLYKVFRRENAPLVDLVV